MRRVFFATLFPVFAAAALTSCASNQPFTPGPHLTLTNEAGLPIPAGAIDQNGDRIFRIGALDELAISVFGVPELTQTVRVDGGGAIALPLVGSLDVSGMTTAEAGNEIATRLRGRYVRDPQVAVNVATVTSQVLTVDGQVTQPGLQPVIGRMTLMQAVASARGATEFARLSDVVVFRTVGDRQYAALYNLQAIRRGMYPDPEVFANDIVVVGDSPSRRMFRDLIQASGFITAPLIALIQR